ncbi:MAG: hypothetical protein LUE29_03595 [Lachnospiraceae bacterium]|nr:hypothetical protein [Lachnospiraceae bacterium]
MKLKKEKDASPKTRPQKEKKEKNDKIIKPGFRRVENINLSDQNFRIRLVVVVFLIVVAVSAFMYGIYSWLSVDAGWYEIEAGSSAETLEAQELYLYYNIGAGETGAYTEYRTLITTYTGLVDEAYKLFSDESFDDCNNLNYLNNHINETVTVDTALYEALSLLDEYESRYIYFAPIYATYESLYSCSYDEETVNFDPAENDVIAEYFEEIVAFANDPDSVRIELLEDNQVMLVVSEEYQAYAEGNAITEYVDFFLLANAFEVDYIAEKLIADGYTAGTLSSYDGYTRTLGASGDDTISETVGVRAIAAPADDNSSASETDTDENTDATENTDGTDIAAALEWSLSLSDRVDQTIYEAGNMTYSGALSVVTFRDYPVYTMDELHYYSLSDGEIRTPYIDLTDGYCKASIHNLVVFSDTAGCAELMIRTLPLYAANAFDREAVEALATDGIDSVIIEDEVISCTTDEVVFTEVHEGYDVAGK